MTVIIELEDNKKTFTNVTKFKTITAFSPFENTIVIYQNQKKTTFKEYQVLRTTVISQ